MKKTAEMIEVMQAHVDGKPIEARRCGLLHGWIPAVNPSWVWTVYDYRIAQTDDQIDWSHVAPEFKYLARDEDGSAYVTTGRPKAFKTDASDALNGCWGQPDDDCIRFVTAKNLASYKRGNKPWDQSLVVRPGVET